MILDTNAYSALARGTQAAVDAISSADELKFPLPVIAELRYGFAKGSLAEHNEQQLERFLSQPQVSILMPTLKTTEYYADLQFLCQRKCKALSQNDIWIASLTQESGDVLLTFDKDFTVFLETFGDKLLILG